MGCSPSKTGGDLVVRPNGVEASELELSVALQPGGKDVSPMAVDEKAMSPKSAKDESGEDNQRGDEMPEDEATETATPSDKPTESAALVFEPSKCMPDDNGVIFYGFDAVNPADPSKEVRLSKRYSQFKALHAEMATLMANEKNVSEANQDKFETYPALPALPKASFLRRRDNEKMLEEREAAFCKMLNAIARHPVAFRSEAFTAFCA